LFKDRLKTMMGGASTRKTSTPTARHSSNGTGTAQATGPSYTRHSNGLDQFFAGLRGQVGLNILDFAGASQANVSFITNLGHRLSSEDYLRSLEITFGDKQFYENQDDPELAERFLDANLNFPDGHFDGALIWDALQFLSPPLLEATIERLRTILRPNSSLLAFFHADEKAEQVPLYNYRISDEKTLMLTPRGSRKRAQFFNNRGLEKLFQDQTVKFFLTRDNLREIIVRR
jgi:hypothetical protein